MRWLPRSRRVSGAPLAALALLAVVLAANTAASAATANRSAPADQLQAAWVELGPGQGVIVRAITEAAGCPKVNVDGRGKSMRVRAAATPPDYPVLTCEKAVDASADRISVAGRRLHSLPGRVRRIAVVGDTGCRLAGPGRSQACNEPDQWPFKRVGNSIAEWSPEMIVHTGDYLYREQPCPQGDAGCAGSPFGENWPTWDADFFTPGARALKAAPWMLVRGNHEDCPRAGEGWFRFLDPLPMPSSCQDITAPYSVPVGAGLRMVVMDSANASDFSPFNPEPYVPQFAALPELAGRKAWLLTHRPIWGLASISMGTDFAVTNTTLEMASGNSLPGSVRQVLSGHLHNVELLGFTGDRAPQIVAGNGGTLLDDPITRPIVGADVVGETITDAEVESRFGFLTYVSRGPGWTVVVRDVDGDALARCRLARKSVQCESG